MVGVAQLVRASGCGPEGRRFDPDRSPHKNYKGYKYIACNPFFYF